MIKLGSANVTRIVDLDPFVLPFNFLLPGRDPAELSGEAALLSPDHVDFEAGTPFAAHGPPERSILVTAGAGREGFHATIRAEAPSVDRGSR